ARVGVSHRATPTGVPTFAAVDHWQTALQLLGLQVVSEAKRRIAPNRCHHSAKLSQPELHPDLYQRIIFLLAVDDWAGNPSLIDQCQKTAQQTVERHVLQATEAGKLLFQLGRQVAGGDGTVAQNHQQVTEEGVMLQRFSKGY